MPNLVLKFELHLVELKYNADRVELSIINAKSFTNIGN